MSLVYIRAAIEIAIKNMPGIVPAAAIISSSINGKFNAPAHGLTTGLNVNITGHTGSVPAIAGSYLVNVVDADNFTLQNVVTQRIITLSTGGSGGTVLANLTAWENVSFQTTSGVGYQQCFLLPAKPANPTFGAPFHRELGIYQINLFYPQAQGTGLITQRAELIRSTFPRNSTFVNNGIYTIISETPEIGNPSVDSDDRFMLPVKLPYYANVFS